ncbi:hypothetical protein MML48_2g00011422 [Holotrichia oblita]|uniref:Uncharacterized protein n=1 Tax=Holotrichia oblita TaxID=644536 RepID=A0ACB9TL42_HOLOL|nr:hypothetical protein MML48_2g00011422 [Holotrichia oblita]
MWKTRNISIIMVAMIINETSSELLNKAINFIKADKCLASINQPQLLHIEWGIN